MLRLVNQLGSGLERRIHLHLHLLRLRLLRGCSSHIKVDVCVAVWGGWLIHWEANTSSVVVAIWCARVWNTARSIPLLVSEHVLRLATRGTSW